MKTQVLKNNETGNASNSMMITTLIIFGCLLLYATNKINPQFGNSSSNSQKKYVNEELVTITDNQENALSSSRNAGELVNSIDQFSMGKMQEYLIAENEPELEIGEVLSIKFPDVEPVELTTDYASGNDQFLNDLKIQASEKTNKTLELLALEKKMKEYLTIETEQPLQLENWMTDEKCWCRSLQEPTALTEKK